MNKITVTKTVCRQIVQLGSEFRMTNSQKTDPRRPYQLAGHFTGQLQYTFNQNSDREAHVMVLVGDTAFPCYCPLLPPGERIEMNTVVMFQRNRMNGRWEIFAVECP